MCRIYFTIKKCDMIGRTWPMYSLTYSQTNTGRLWIFGSQCHSHLFTLQYPSNGGHGDFPHWGNLEVFTISKIMENLCPSWHSHCGNLITLTQKSLCMSGLEGSESELFFHCIDPCVTMFRTQSVITHSQHFILLTGNSLLWIEIKRLQAQINSFGMPPMFDTTDILKVIEQAEHEMRENMVEIPVAGLKMPVKQVKKSIKSRERWFIPCPVLFYFKLSSVLKCFILIDTESWNVLLLKLTERMRCELTERWWCEETIQTPESDDEHPSYHFKIG